jgi:hypothetical protein
MQWLELHPEFGLEVAKYRAELEEKDISTNVTTSLVSWKPDPSIVDMWKRWAQEQEENERVQHRQSEHGNDIFGGARLVDATLPISVKASTANVEAKTPDSSAWQTRLAAVGAAISVLLLLAAARRYYTRRT